MTRYRWTLTAVLAVVAVALVIVWGGRTSPPVTATGMGSAALIPVDERQHAADFTGLDGWLNSPPLTLGGLHGKVVLVDFWTFSCVNCVRTIPHLQHLEASYAQRGLVIVGVHSPEFDFEKVRANVAAAVQRDGVTWPVALDSQMNTWNAYGNQYWPAEYLLDQQGRVAYIHDGEGDYDVTESAITALLGINATPASSSPTADISKQTPELYAGSARGQLADGANYGGIGVPTRYPDPGAPQQTDAIQVTGTWTDQGEYLVSNATGHIRLNFSARDVYIVAGPDGSNPLRLTVSLDGAPVTDSQRGPDLSPAGLVVSVQQLYDVLTGVDGSSRHVIDISVPAGLRLYTFTFG